MPDSPVRVTSKALRTALRIWMKVAPTRLWRDLEKADKAGHDQPGSPLDPLQRYDARDAIADYVADKFEQADWQITRDKPELPQSPPPYRRMD